MFSAEVPFPELEEFTVPAVESQASFSRDSCKPMMHLQAGESCFSSAFHQHLMLLALNTLLVHQAKKGREEGREGGKEGGKKGVLQETSFLASACSCS